MAASKANVLLEYLAEHGWHVDRGEAHPLRLDSVITSRYPKLPSTYIQFLEQFCLCTNSDETAWFLSEQDFNGQSGYAFAWDEFEAMSVVAAEGDEEFIQTIDEFWHRHIPILLSVKSGYAFLAMTLSQENFGEVVIGHEPEFEEAITFCSSFDELVALLTLHLGGKEDSLLAGLL